MMTHFLCQLSTMGEHCGVTITSSCVPYARRYKPQLACHSLSGDTYIRDHKLNEKKIIKRTTAETTPLA